MKDCQIKFYNRGEVNCESLSLERNVIVLTSRNIQADLRSTCEIDVGFAAVSEAPSLKNVPTARQLLPEERILRESRERERGDMLRSAIREALRLMSLDGRHLRNHKKHTPLKRQFHCRTVYYGNTDGRRSSRHSDTESEQERELPHSRDLYFYPVTHAISFTGKNIHTL